MRTLDYAMLGRWCGHWAKGVWFHPSIQNASAVRGEKLWGWVLHYLAGIALVDASAGAGRRAGRRQNPSPMD